MKMGKGEGQSPAHLPGKGLTAGDKGRKTKTFSSLLMSFPTYLPSSHGIPSFSGALHPSAKPSPGERTLIHLPPSPALPLSLSLSAIPPPPP